MFIRLKTYKHIRFSDIKKIIILPVLIFSIFFISCTKEYQTRRYEKILVSNSWAILTYVDNSQNITIDTEFVIYNFYEDRTLEKIYENGDVATSTWELYGNNKYLRMGNNNFGLQTLTNKVLAVRYGNIDIFYVSL